MQSQFAIHSENNSGQPITCEYIRIYPNISEFSQICPNIWGEGMSEGRLRIEVTIAVGLELKGLLSLPSPPEEERGNVWRAMEGSWDQWLGVAKRACDERHLGVGIDLGRNAWWRRCAFMVKRSRAATKPL